MKTYKHILSILVILAAGVFLAACNDDDIESMQWRPGSGLHIIGESDVAVGDTASFYVDGFTVTENYEWKLNNNVIQPERGGEFVTIIFPNAGPYTLTVSNGRLTGTTTITAE